MSKAIAWMRELLAWQILWVALKILPASATGRGEIVELVARWMRTTLDRQIAEAPPRIRNRLRAAMKGAK